MTRGRAQVAEARPRDVEVDDAKALLRAYIARQGLKSTRQRDLIVEAFLAKDGHWSVEELLERVRREDKRVSSATVYRTMKLLADCGLAASRHFDDGQARYEAVVGRHHHDHLICTGCHAIVEFEDERIEALQLAVARRHGFTVTDHKLELYGLCEACRGKGDGAEASGRSGRSRASTGG
jgi:Fur family ferric uptake transcriptional regulator